MPASSFSSTNSWAIYLFAAASLVFLFVPQLSGVVRASRASADWRNLDGARAALDHLRPGITLLFSYGSAGVSDEITLRGHEVSCSDGNGTVSMPVTWALPHVELAPGVEYRFSLAGGTVRVVQGV